MKLISRTQLEGRPEAALFKLPEKVLQFGTGVLLRGLPDFLIDQANRQGIFNGRIVAVKTTSQGDGSAFERQDNLYTICTRGVADGQLVHEDTICAAISRVLFAERHWGEVLACAADPQVGVVISNTTEVGIRLLREDVRQSPPASFPGKLLAVLHERYRAFQGDLSKGMVIVPTELIPDNGKQLEAIVLELAHYNQLEYAFMEWLEQACVFCDSLVDRIVPGAPPAGKAEEHYRELGYRDELLALAEPYRLWAIEGDERVAAALSFAQAEPESVIIAPDISRYRERKLRLLNGTHTLCCSLAHLAGFATVAEAMGDAGMAGFTQRLMLQEIAPAIPGGLPPEEAETFARQVLDRFRNPYVEHRWLSIAAQQISKMRMRVVPLLLERYRRRQGVPQGMALGFAAFLAFYREAPAGVPDDRAAHFREKWQQLAPAELVPAILSDESLWGTDLAALPGFAPAVARWLNQILEQGAQQALHAYSSLNHEAQSAANTSV